MNIKQRVTEVKSGYKQMKEILSTNTWEDDAYTLISDLYTELEKRDKEIWKRINEINNSTVKCDNLFDENERLKARVDELEGVLKYQYCDGHPNYQGDHLGKEIAKARAALKAARGE